MFELILGFVLAQATGIPEGVWIALIGAISGVVIKPIFDLISKALDNKKDNAAAADDEAKAKDTAHKEQVKRLEQALKDERTNSARLVDEAQKSEGEWREKYWTAMERFSGLHNKTQIPDKLDLSDPSVLKQIIQHIASE